MAKLRVHNFALSLDGFGAGPDQGPDSPLGVDGMRLHDWVFETSADRETMGEDGGEAGLDSDFIAAGDVGIGATIMGRNMFGPVRGPWPDHEWTGWWGPNPPYHHQVFVLTHHVRPSVEMEGGTTFHFVDATIEAALEWAVEAADGADVRLAGGVSVIQQYMAAGLVDELHLALVPILLGRGERFFDNLGESVAAYEVVEQVSSPAVTHVRLAKR